MRPAQLLAVLTLPTVMGSCGSSAVQLQPETQALALTITAVVALPPELDFGQAAEQQRASRRMGDSVLSATGGRAIIAEELKGVQVPQMPALVRSLGEDPARVLTFSVVAGRSDRVDFSSPPLSGAPRGPMHVVYDYNVRLEVRRVGGHEVIGSIDTAAGAVVGDAEVTPSGESIGLPKAIDDAVRKAVQTYAPGLVTRAVLPRIIELPPPAADAKPVATPVTVDRLRRVQLLYPERPATELVALASSQARFLVITPGSLASVGILAGDLLGATSAGPALTSRAHLLRMVARGTVPALYVERQGERFLVGQTMLATSGR
jgi:hypothetical protein